MRKTVDLLGVGRQKDRRLRPDAYRRRIRRLCEPVSLPPRLARRTDTTTATISGLGVALSNHRRSLPLLFKCKLLSAGQQWNWPAMLASHLTNFLSECVGRRLIAKQPEGLGSPFY